MSKRKTAQQRIEEYRIKADKLEAAAKLRALRNSPAWKATFKAMKNLEEARDLLSTDEGRDSEHLAAMHEAWAKLVNIQHARFGS